MNVENVKPALRILRSCNAEIDRLRKIAKEQGCYLDFE
jgi:hypothetical protein